jgi:hypothetical protein
VRYERQSLDDLAATLAGYGIGDAFIQGLADMKRAKDEGLDDGVPRTPQARRPSSSGAIRCSCPPYSPEYKQASVARKIRS